MIAGIRIWPTVGVLVVGLGMWMLEWFFLQEFKEDGLITIKHVPTDDNKADIFTKNVDASSLHIH